MGMGPRREQSEWEDIAMRLKHQWWSRLMAAVLMGSVSSSITSPASGE